MRRRIKLKKRNYIFKENKGKVIIIIIIFLFIFIIIIINFLNKKVSPILLDYAEIESRKMAGIIINNAVSKNIGDNVDINDFFLITKDNDEIKTIDFNPIVVNQILTKITTDVQTDLKYIQQGKVEMLDIRAGPLTDYDLNKLKKGIICEIPSGVIFNKSILTNIGPRIPVKISLAGSIASHVNTKVTDYGINSALIEVNIVLELSEQVILPFVKSKIKIESKIPVALKLVQGNVPNYYSNGINTNSPSLAFPVE